MRVAAQRVEVGIVLEPFLLAHPGGNAFLQAIDGLFRLAQAGINAGKVVKNSGVARLKGDPASQTCVLGVIDDARPAAQFVRNPLVRNPCANHVGGLPGRGILGHLRQYVNAAGPRVAPQLPNAPSLAQNLDFPFRIR